MPTCKESEISNTKDELVDAMIDYPILAVYGMLNYPKSGFDILSNARNYYIFRDLDREDLEYSKLSIKTSVCISKIIDNFIENDLCCFDVESDTGCIVSILSILETNVKQSVMDFNKLYKENRTKCLKKLYDCHFVQSLESEKLEHLVDLLCEYFGDPEYYDESSLDLLDRTSQLYFQTNKSTAIVEKMTNEFIDHYSNIVFDDLTSDDIVKIKEMKVVSTYLSTVLNISIQSKLEAISTPYDNIDLMSLAHTLFNVIRFNHHNPFATEGGNSD